MDFFSTIISNMVVFEIISDLFSITIGAGLCYGALKWRRGLLTSTAIGWGALLGLVIAVFLTEIAGETGALIGFLTGLIGLPVLTYTVPGVNRFILGYLVSCKLFFMATTVLMKSGTMDIGTAFALPLAAGTLTGLCLMAWTKMRVSAFVLACSFIGASEIAPSISNLINRLIFSVTGDYSILFDPYDVFFALFKVELTDGWTLLAMILLMLWGGYKQIKSLNEHNIPLDTPLIGFEGPVNGRVYTKNGYIDTIDKK